MTLQIPNRTARWLWLESQALSHTPTGPVNLLETIRHLGYVQLDSIQTIARAHHHILWSRNQNYREPMLDKLLGEDRTIFEHYTHDASVLPMEFYPMWQRQFKRLAKRSRNSTWGQTMTDARGRSAFKKRIREEGPLSTKAFDSKSVGKREMWQRPPHKIALDYMWYAGELSTSHRVNFTKYYDLTERVVPTQLREQTINDREQIQWLCDEAMQRLRFATVGEIQRFWEAMELAEAKKWAEQSTKDLIEVEIECADRSVTTALARPTIEQDIATVEKPTSRLRILNPFDPVIRDRARLSRLFGFDYKIEIFVPAAKREWGYYVYPLLEGDRFVGRLETRVDRKAGTLEVLKLWSERRAKWNETRLNRLRAELQRAARFAGVEFNEDVALKPEERTS